MTEDDGEPIPYELPRPHQMSGTPLRNMLPRSRPYVHRLGETWGPAFTVRDELPLFLRKPDGSVLRPFREMTVPAGGLGCFRCAVAAVPPALFGYPGHPAGGYFYKVAYEDGLPVSLEDVTGLMWRPRRREPVVLVPPPLPLARLSRII